MPILQREVSRFPDELFDHDFQRSQSEEGASWWAIYTMSRKDKELMRQLCHKRIPFYSPVIESSYRTTTGRLRRSYLPLFANYVFVLTGEEGRVRAFETNCVSRCLEIHDSSEFVAQLKQFEVLIQSNTPLTVESKLVPGQRIRVKSGPFTGMVGTVFRRKQQSRLLIALDFLQQGASLEIHDWDLEEV